MSLLRRPFFWSVLLAVGLALTVGGGSPSEMDNPGDADGSLSDPSLERVVVVHGEAVGDVDGGVVDEKELVHNPVSDDLSDVGGPTEEDLASLEEATRPRIVSHVVQPGETLS